VANDSATNERDEMKLRFSDHGCQEPPQARVMIVGPQFLILRRRSS
jgi:hypothetical protein